MIWLGAGLAERFCMIWLGAGLAERICMILAWSSTGRAFLHDFGFSRCRYQGMALAVP
jgi:hypothetical protein